MPISVRCSCGKKFGLPEKYAGKKVACPGCRNAVRVPEAAAPAAEAPPAAQAPRARPAAAKDRRPRVARPAPPPPSEPEPPEEEPSAPPQDEIACPACGEGMPASAAECPHCGEAVPGDAGEEEEAPAAGARGKRGALRGRAGARGGRAGTGRRAARRGAPAEGTGGTSGLAIAALVTGLIACPLFPLPLILGFLALGDIRRQGKGGKGLAIAGMVLGGVQLVAGIVVGAFLAGAVAIPGLTGPRSRANEVSAIGTLKSLSTAQEQFKSAACVDCDGDGTGEYGYFQELSGTSNWRTNGGLAGLRVSPPFMADSLGTTAAGAAGIANRSGYNFLIFLPGAAAPPVQEAVPVPGGDAAQANGQETRWACYAWPTSAGTSGNRCFVTNQEGQVYEALNAAPLYDGTAMPVASGNAAYAAAGGNLDGAVVSDGSPASDGQVWTTYSRSR
ncbi:MAG: DUF4190 domain-containing protein [Planctomycetes bacterium]|nr:DUF4190 domain-containing protein [Planctomycetota bacterium]